MKNLLLSLAFLITVSSSSFLMAADITSAGDGNWNSTTPNAPWPGGTVPSPTDDVFIRPGDDISVTADATINSITFLNTAVTARNLTVNASVTFTVTTSITLQNAIANNTAATLAGAGTINCASITIGGTITNPSADRTQTLTSTVTTLGVSGNITIKSEDNVGSQGNSTFILTSGMITVGGTVILDAANDGATPSTSTLNLNGGGAETGTLSLGGATPFSTPSTGTVVIDFAGTASTVIYSGAAQTVRPATYTNLTLSGSGVKTTTGVTVSTKLSMQGDGTVSVSVAPTYSSAILEYKGSAPQTTGLEFPAAMSNEVIIDNALGVTLDAAKTLDNDLTLSNGTLTAGTSLTMAAGPNNIFRIGGEMTGTLQGANTYNVTYTGNSKTTGAELSGSGLLTVTVNLTAGQILTLDQNRAPDGNLTVTAGTFDLSTFTINRSVAGGTLTISNGATLKIGGTNTVPTNYSTHSIGISSTIEYAGSNQSIVPLNNTAATQYGNLTSSGTGVKTLSGATLVRGVLTLTGGIINTTTNLLTIASTGSTSGGSSSSFVEGPLARIKNTTANSSLFFPIGKGTAYRPASLSLTHSAATATTYTAQVFNTAPTARTLPGTIDLVSLVRYWNVIKGTGATVTAAAITLNYDSDDGVTDAANLRIAKDNGAGAWVDLGGTGSGTPSGSILSTINFTAFSDFVLANATGGTNPLPVELSSFSALVVGSTVKLSWKTESEVNNYGFEVERASLSAPPLRVWEKIGFVNGNGNSNSPKSYSYEDKNVTAGKYSYRLKQIDNDGQFEYSKTIEVDFGTPGKFELAQNFPNPFNPETAIRFTLPAASSVKLTVFNLLGQEVKLLVNEYKEAGTHIINFNASDFNSGVYIYRLETNGVTQTRKMILVK